MYVRPCDYLGHVTVNAFPVLKFFYNEENPKESYFYCQNGQYRKYPSGSALPIKRLYYKLPETFYIVTYKEDEILLVIKDGHFERISSLDNANVADIPVFDTNGNKLKINSINDIRLMKIDMERAFNKEITVEHFISIWIDTNYIDDVLFTFGRYICMFRELYIQNDKPFKHIKKTFQEFLKEQDIEAVVLKYKEWLGDETLISFKDIDKIISLTMEEGQD